MFKWNDPWALGVVLKEWEQHSDSRIRSEVLRRGTPPPPPIRNNFCPFKVLMLLLILSWENLFFYLISDRFSNNSTKSGSPSTENPPTHGNILQTIQLRRKFRRKIELANPKQGIWKESCIGILVNSPGVKFPVVASPPGNIPPYEKFSP